MIANAQRIVKGIWIPIEIWCAGDLNWNEKILLMEISSFTDVDRDCYMSNHYIAKLLNVTEVSASRLLSSLIRKGYVEKTRFDGRRRFIRSLIVTARQTYQEGLVRLNTNDKSGLTPALTDLYKMNNIDYNTPTGDNTTEESITNVISSSSVISPVESSAHEKGQHKRKFVPPTVEEVRDYIRGRGPEYQSIDPEQFVAFYQSKGWTVGKSPMKDWHAALVTWARRNRRDGRPSRGGEPVIAPVELALEQNERTMRELMEKAREEIGEEELKSLPL